MSKALDFLTAALVEDILKAPDEEVLLQALAERFEKFRAERDFLTAQLAGERKNIAGWIAARDANLARATTAEAALTTAREALRRITTIEDEPWSKGAAQAALSTLEPKP